MVTPEARLSCARCHKRKKRCDKGLPACKNCQNARVRCSFLESENHTTASYPVNYVKDLESRIQALEKQLVSAQLAPDQLKGSEPQASTTEPAPDVYRDPSFNQAIESTLGTAKDSVSSAARLPAQSPWTGQPPGSPSSSRAQPFQHAQTHPLPPSHSGSPPPSHLHMSTHLSYPQTGPSPHSTQDTPLPRPASMGTGSQPRPPPATVPSPSFAQELKTLSLEATAERHLGSSSGVSFAKLTQMILRRLTPDKADFVFPDSGISTGTGVQSHSTENSSKSNNIDNNANENNASNFNSSNADAQSLITLVNDPDPQLIHFDSPSDLFNSSVFHSLGQSISVHPLLFGDVFLADIIEPDTALVGLNWPSNYDDAHVNMLIEFYFAHSNTLYPIIIRQELIETMRIMREDPQGCCSILSPLALFRAWMVLAIGATAFSSVSLTEESEPMLYYNKALQYSEPALALDEVAALEVLTLQVSYSFFNQLGPNTWFLVGISARLALGLGLHTASTYKNMPCDAIERRKRIFFSIYMMDRVVSIALGRPFAIHDDDIDVTPFEAIDDECITPERILPQSSLQPSIMAVPLHILSLRRIASNITRQVYTNRQADSLSVQQREEILMGLHRELIDWRRNMPFPLIDVDSRVPHLCGTWYDFNYYTHLASIYRPSPLFPVMDQKRVKILENAAAMSVRQAYNLHQQRRFAYNWLNFLALFTSTLSLIYATTAQPENLASVLNETRAIEDLELAIELFSTLSVKFSAARKIGGMISEICKRYKDVKRYT
ncbi:c6 zinc finger domain containing protein [Ophiostoma piceae UAMH 11346]|uniref:C6 zinc finger domain containing protein n=1 Tax=Ophiostoma piceae (strain UAMH 11346) TaxID=1262450 RepID=S3BXC2_OPHP1|nr:c6 zinc finger domain containing protein [Ophiostoma piceae UAMH 11346]